MSGKQINTYLSIKLTLFDSSIRVLPKTTINTSKEPIGETYSIKSLILLDIGRVGEGSLLVRVMLTYSKNDKDN
ncbi:MULTISPECIES: hypothetical protein [Pontibacillus]|uniref:Uncharacterized protein n=1 Tax=Pontibacillus chungwhensis TaxID=265426 RepID=A0ABY8V4B7_9BACI|nr:MULTISPECIES: hypothetical protein [Pontibacillus]WIF99689.1 hypothetical protein QNI29_08555 [Pontibacillus chungwhensis]